MAESSVLVVAALVITIPIVLFLCFLAVDACFIRPKRDRLRQQASLDESDTPKRFKLERSSRSSMNTSYSSRQSRSSSSFSMYYPEEQDKHADMAETLLPYSYLPPLAAPVPSYQLSSSPNERTKEDDLESAVLLPPVPQYHTP